MLISLSITNFRSFRDEQVLSLTANSRDAAHPEHLSVIPDDDQHKVLPVAVLYGANGAGKTNLVLALQFLDKQVCGVIDKGRPTGRRAFALADEMEKIPTEIVVQFTDGTHSFVYGCRFGNQFVEAEWLSVVRNGRERNVFERVTTSEGEVTVEAGPELKESSTKESEKLFALIKVTPHSSQLFLNLVYKNLDDGDRGPILDGACGWFSRLTVIPADSKFSRLVDLLRTDSSFARFAGGFLKAVGTGVDEVSVPTIDLSETALSKLSPELNRIVATIAPGESRILANSDTTIEKSADGRLQMMPVSATHTLANGKQIKIPFVEESDGTQRLMHLLPALHTIGNESQLFVIDEIDRSLHPLLAKRFVREFLDKCAGTRGQLIFTTHETAFLDLGLLRRDEIWFADKSRDEGSTELYSLSDYKVRQDLIIDKAYLEGRFDAVPPVESPLPDWVMEIQKELHPAREGFDESH